MRTSKPFEKLSEEYIEKAIDCFKLKSVKSGESVARREDLCRKLIFFVAEGNYYITDNSKRSKLYGAQGLEDHECKFKIDIKMKEDGKIAWTTLD